MNETERIAENLNLIARASRGEGVAVAEHAVARYCEEAAAALAAQAATIAQLQQHIARLETETKRWIDDLIAEGAARKVGPFRQILAVIQSPAVGAEHPGNQAIAERIAEELFVNGSGQEAHRLVLTSRDGRDLGGWGKGPLTDRIVGVLAGVPGEK